MLDGKEQPNETSATCLDFGAGKALYYHTANSIHYFYWGLLEE